MNTILIISAFICAAIGIIGAIVPGLPGPPVAWAALLLLHFSDAADYSLNFFLIMAAIAIIITILDFVVPAWGTKRFGGTKAGVKGSTIGLIVSVFLPPILGITIGPFGIVGILAGPFLGALVGENLFGNKEGATRAAWGSFIGFLAGTAMKLTFGIIILVIVIKDVIN